MALDADTFLAEAAEPFAFIRPLANGTYEPYGEGGEVQGIPALQCPVITGDDVLDIVAWQWDEPGIWWLRLDQATWLGDHMFRRGRRQKLLLVETPADYVANHGECVCVLDWTRVDLIDAFYRGPTVVFASDRLRRRFDQRWGEQIQQAERAAIPRYAVVA